MIQGFEKETAPLSSYEREQLLPVMIETLSQSVGKNLAVTSSEICRMCRQKGLQINGPRVRKIINHIRINGLVPCLIATSVGYYVAESKNEMRDYLDSLVGREGAIRAVRESMAGQLTLLCEN